MMAVILWLIILPPPDNGSNEKIAYSFGIANDVSWDLDMANRGYEVFMYDMTINSLPQENPKFHFFKEGIAGAKIPEQSLDTLENFVNRNGHANKDNMILKMDVEGAEWNFLSEVSSDLLKRFDQIVFELHWLIQSKRFTEMALITSLISKLNLTHTLVHLHGNFTGGPFIEFENIGIFPDVLEATFVKKENYTLYYDENIHLPISLDRPNSAELKDIELGYWNKN